MWRELAQLRRDFLQLQSDTLRKNDERDASKSGAWVATMPSGIAFRLNEPPLLVEPQGRRSDPTAFCELSNRERVHGS
jgi:hypothetical protein